MSRVFYTQEIAKPEDVIPYLAKQERHWRKAYPTYELAHSWINVEEIPAPVRSVLETCPENAGAAMVEGLFEPDVDLRTPELRSQTNLRVYAKLAHGNAVIAAEGTMDKPFDRPLTDQHHEGVVGTTSASDTYILLGECREYGATRTGRLLSHVSIGSAKEDIEVPPEYYDPEDDLAHIIEAYEMEPMAA